MVEKPTREIPIVVAARVSVTIDELAVNLETKSIVTNLIQEKNLTLKMKGNLSQTSNCTSENKESIFGP